MPIFRRLRTEPTEKNPRSTDLDDPLKRSDNPGILVPKREEFLRDLAKLGKKPEPESPEPE
jgi:hypothetical protein